MSALQTEQPDALRVGFATANGHNVPGGGAASPRASNETLSPCIRLFLGKCLARRHSLHMFDEMLDQDRRASSRSWVARRVGKGNRDHTEATLGKVRDLQGGTR